MATTRILPALALVGSGLLLGCSDGTDLSAPVETLVELEAAWQCDVTRFSFEDSTAIATRAEEHRTRYGVSDDDYAIFTEMLHDDVALRESVALRIDEQCQPTNDVTGDS